MNFEVKERSYMIFRNEKEGKVWYNLGLSKKNQDGSYTRGSIMVRFKTGVELEDKVLIKIKKGWLDFYVKEKRTYPYIFVSEFDKVVPDKKEDDDPFKTFGDKLAFTDDENDDFPF